MKVAGELQLKPGKERSLQRRHPWVYDTAIASVRGRPGAGDLVAIRAKGGDWLAWAAYAPASTLRARCWSFVESDSIDAAWFGARVDESVRRRTSLNASTSAIRLVFGEADRLPGFVADRYADQLVVQLQSCGAEAQRDIAAAFAKHGFSSLGPVVVALGGKYDYGECRIVRAAMQSGGDASVVPR